MKAKTGKICFPGRSGGNGRRAAFRAQWPQGRRGSTPRFGTTRVLGTRQNRHPQRSRRPAHWDWPTSFPRVSPNRVRSRTCAPRGCRARRSAQAPRDWYRTCQSPGCLDLLGIDCRGDCAADPSGIAAAPCPASSYRLAEILSTPGMLEWPVSPTSARNKGSDRATMAGMLEGEAISCS
jgi:hypothetical protein